MYVPAVGVGLCLVKGIMVLLSCFLVFVPTLLGDRWDLITTNVMVVFHNLSIRGSCRPLSVFVYGFCTSKHILYIPVVFLDVYRVWTKQQRHLTVALE